jgi:hypothetical protein
MKRASRSFGTNKDELERSGNPQSEYLSCEFSRFIGTSYPAIKKQIIFG